MFQRTKYKHDLLQASRELQFAQIWGRETVDLEFLNKIPKINLPKILTFLFLNSHSQRKRVIDSQKLSFRDEL